MTIQPASAPGTSATSPNANNPGALSLTLPPTTYAKLLPQKFLAAHLPSARPSGRRADSFRPASVHTGSLTHAHGSAVVRIGDTAAVCGVRAEILNARDTDISDDFDALHGNASGSANAERIAALALLVPNVELNTGCNPAFLPGSAPGQIAQALTHRLLSMLRVAHLISLKELCIYEDSAANHTEPAGADSAEGDSRGREIKAYFTLYIDILFISLSGPHSAFDTAWLAIQTALRDTKLPLAHWDRDADGVLCDPRRENYSSLTTGTCSAALSWCVFMQERSGRNGVENDGRAMLLVDPDDFEESCCTESGVVVVTFSSDSAADSGLLLRVEKHGGQAVGASELKVVLDAARKRWEEWSSLLN